MSSRARPSGMQPAESTVRTNRVPVYAFHYGFRAIGGLVLGASALLGAIIIPAIIWNGAAWQIVALVLPALGLFTAMGWYAFARHRGGVALMSATVALVRGGRIVKQVPYTELIDIRFYDRHVPPGVTLSTKTEELRFSGSIEKSPQFFGGLFTRAPQLLETHQVRLPLVLDARGAILRDFAGASLFLGALFYGILFWSKYMHDTRDLMEGLAIITFIWIFFSAIVGLLTIRPGQPARIRLDAPDAERPQIRACTFLGHETVLPYAELLSATIVDRSVDVGDAGVSVKKQSFPIAFKSTANQETIYLDEPIARTIGQTPTSLLCALQRTYPHAFPSGPSGPFTE